MKKNKLFIELGNVIKLSVLVTSLTVFLVSIYGLTRVYNNPLFLVAVVYIVIAIIIIYITFFLRYLKPFK